METREQLGFSRLALDMANHATAVEAKRLFGIVDPWPREDMTEAKRNKRVEQASADFWKFDQIYFPPEAYSDGFSKPCGFHKFIVGLWDKPGVHVVLGPRKHGKTAMAKKLMAWLMLTGRTSLNATLSSTLPVSWNILEDIKLLLENPRIQSDFNIDFTESNADQFTLRIPGKKFLARTIALSEGRSTRGATFLFMRPQVIFCDDLETRQSPMGPEQVRARVNMIREAYQSMSEGGSLIIMGNNFDERCALNSLLIEQEQGILAESWHVYTFKAWDKRPLWKSRFPAKSEADLQAMLKVADQSEWNGEFQQQPTPPEGFIFRREQLQFFNTMPKDARGVLYCDPNLAKKGRGDSTAIISLLYSPDTDKYYVDNAACRSFSDSNDLLSTVLKMKTGQHRVIGWDGNVNQESTWTNNIRNYCRINNSPFPFIKYCRYHVDDLAKNVQAIWAEGRLLISERLAVTEDGKRMLAQILAFSGKKANKADDAPDALICAYELIHERHLASRATGRPVSIIQDAYF